METPPDGDQATIIDRDILYFSQPDEDSDHDQLQTENSLLTAEIEALRSSFQCLQSKTAAIEESLAVTEREKEEVVKLNLYLSKRIEEIETEKVTIQDEIKNIMVYLEEKEDAFLKKMENARVEADVYREKIETFESERREEVKFITEHLGLVNSMKEDLVRIIECVGEDKVEGSTSCDETEGNNGVLHLYDELSAFLGEIVGVSNLVSAAQRKVSECQEMTKKEKRELDNSVVSLTEENRDINSLLRIALVEKEAVEKSLNKLKGNNNDQKRAPLLQIAERGLQRVGFGFMMGASTNEQSLENSDAVVSPCKSDSSECDMEVVSLASTVEKIMKNLRLEITQLRRSLEESRSDTERLQSLTKKQAQTIAENNLYMEELEARERRMAHSIEELVMEIKELEEESARWREACELEVQAGKSLVQERDKRAAILQQELEKTMAALDLSNSKLKLKEDLAAAAMAVQAAAERSLHLSDNRAAGLCERIEELTRQLDEQESKDRIGLRVRHICWPWRVLKVNPVVNNTAIRVRNARRMMLPEMQTLLH